LNATSFYYGWRAIVPAAFLVLLVTNGLTVGGIVAWDPALIAQLGVSRGDIKAGDAWQLGITAILTLVTGKLADRYGYRPVMVVGALALLWGFYLLGRVETLADYYWSRIWMGIGLAGAGMAICMVAVSRWFVQSRGLALGLVLAGTSLGNGFMPGIFTGIIERFGWQSAAWVPVAMLALLPIIVLGWMREWPSDRGLRPLGADQAASGAAVSAIGEDLGYVQILRRREFWLLGVAAFATFYSFLGINNNLMLHVMSLGESQRLGAAMFVPLFIAGLGGKVLAGWLSDRWGRRVVWLGCLALMLCGALLLASLSLPWVVPAAVLLGLGWGANYTLLQAVTGDIFGTRSLGRVMGAVTVLDAGGGALGPWITGLLSDRTGDYQFGFLLIAALIALAMVSAALLPMRRN
jgi:MFS family permease